MGYGTPMENQNKGYAAQEKKDLLKDNPVAKVASGGSWMSKHISSPLAMGKGSGMYMNDMAPKMDGPLKGNAFGKAMADNDGNYEAAKASLAPKMHGSPMHKQGEKDKDDESIAGRIGKKGSDISSKDRRDESLGDRGTRTK